MSILANKKILVSPLDWGLGHATRCIPIIQSLIQHQCEVVIAASGPSAVLLKESFPTLLHLEIPSFTYTYTKFAWLFPVKILRQVPKLMQQTNLEHSWLQEQFQIHSFDAVVSDNRFGLYHDHIPCIIMTHQLGLKTGIGNRVNRIVQHILYKKINKFTACWVPDIEGENSLAGELSHPIKKPNIPVYYIGWLSRIQERNKATDEEHLLILLSGPEPQRTIFEELLIQEIKTFSGKVTFVRGLPQIKKEIPAKNQVTFYNSLSEQELSSIFSSASLIICRSGYSSIMDVVLQRKKAVFVPTPAQPEQEYLAEYLNNKNIAPQMKQPFFKLSEAILLSKKYEYVISDSAKTENVHYIDALKEIFSI